MAQFVFLYRRPEEATPPSPAKMQERLQKWQAWFKGVAERGYIKDRGLPLEKAGRVVRGAKRNVTDGPYAEKDLVMGFTLIEARDLAEASELLANHPLLEEGGAIEIRPVMKLEV
jgi:hypothetical protein